LDCGLSLLLFFAFSQLAQLLYACLIVNMNGNTPAHPSTKGLIKF